MFLLHSKFDFFFLFISFFILGALFNQELFSFLAHDEVPPYYGVAYKFYLAGPKQFINVLMHPSATFGHPFIFPMFLGILMKVFGLSSLLGKVYIFIYSSLTLYGLSKLLRIFNKEHINLVLVYILLLATSLYYINLPLLLGDTALLPLTIFYLYHLLNHNYKTALIWAFIIGLTRESFLIFLAGLFIGEIIIQYGFKYKNKDYFKALLWSPLSAILWYIYNLLIEKKLLHTYASFDKSSISHFDFSINFWIETATQRFKTIFILDPIIGISFLFTLVSLFFIKRFSETHKRLVIYALSINAFTFILLSFYHIFLDRYLLYSAYLFVICFVLLINSFQINKWLKSTIIILPLVTYLFYTPKFSEPYYGKKVNKAYGLTLDALNFLAEKKELDKPIVLCFPYHLFSLNEMGLYPHHPYQITHYNKFNIRKIEGTYFYFICRPDITEDTYYRKYFFDKPKEKLETFEHGDQKLEVWLFTN
jgi:hypothetical protein